LKKQLVNIREKGGRVSELGKRWMDRRERWTYVFRVAAA
jgi:hypothetical protein